MKLQQIKLSGFKSFVESTTININGHLVGIVGPNGCGKSNVIDAVRWVLGESSAKQLRGESMLDVIFNGSLKRKAVSRATVELVFDNTAKSLYGLWNSYDEIAIKRLLTRQGESSYFINNQQVRKKDIVELFLGTGVGTKGYAVIEQGMISRIIESRPEDMRLFIEEAAGVSKYRERRRETLQRLASTNENLSRLQDIYSEILKQVDGLKEQAEVAKHYQKLAQELEQNQLLALALKINGATENLQTLAQTISAYQDELATLGVGLEEINFSLTWEQENKTKEELVLQELLQQFNEYRTNLARVEERYKHYNDLLTRFELESANLKNKEIELVENIVELNLQTEDVANKIAKNQDDLFELELIRDQQRNILEEKELHYGAINQAATNQQNEIAKFKHELDLLQNSLNHKKQQKNQLTIRASRLLEQNNVLDFDQNYHFLKDEIELVKEDIEQCHEQVSHKTQQLDQALLDETNWQKIVREKSSLLAASQARINTLHELIVKAQNDSPDAEFLPADTVICKLWQALEVTPGFEIALDAALGQLIQANVIKAKNISAEIPSKHCVLWLASEVYSQPQVGTLSEQVKIINPELYGLYDYLNNYQIVNELALNSEASPYQYKVTLAGHLATKDYIIYHPSGESNNILQYQQQLSDAKGKHTSLVESLIHSEEDLQKQQQNIGLLRNDLASWDGHTKRLSVKQHDLQLEFTKQEQIFVQNQRHHERVTQESELIKNEIIHLTDDINSLEIQLEDKQLLLDNLQSNNQNNELLQLEQETSLTIARNKLKEQDERANQLIIDGQLLRQQKLNIENMITDKHNQKTAATQKLADLNAEIQSFDNTQQAKEIALLQEQINLNTNQMQLTQASIDVLGNKIIGLKNKASTLNSSYQRYLEKINQAKFKEQEQQILLSTFKESLAEHEFAEDDLNKLVATNQLGFDSLIEQSKKLENQIRDLGLVNLKAIEDLAVASSKETELLLQLEDLQTAIQALDAAILQIDEETRCRLQDTFDKLNTAIVIYFQTLFGGGSARLALTDSDILNAGVQIFAEPPGKKNSTIHLLSGGEKALAAMSFIFALFSLNPAPFCLLDEVDAPLDDANTGRFCKLVQELAGKTQFVYISHNRLAMEMADQLVGVTMQEKGVSSVVSVSLVDAVSQAQADNDVAT